MSLIKDKISKDQKKQQEIMEKVSTGHIRPTKEEQDRAQEVIRVISEHFAEQLRSTDIEDIRGEIEEAAKEECGKLNLSFEEQKRIEKTVLLTALGNGPIEVYIQDPEVTEIVVQRYDNVVIERLGRIQKADAVFNSEEHLQTIIKRIIQRAGRQINLMMPIEDARLPDGSRVNATLPPVSVDGATLTIRKFNQRALSGKDYIRYGSLNKEMLYFLERCVRGKLSIFISGGTGTGKTTLLNMLSSFIPGDELIVTIEDTCELRLQQPNIRRMEVRLSGNPEMMQVDQKALVKAALRQRPDRIILGETRDGSVVDLISAMSTGHEGSMSTVHANSPSNLCNVRFPILYSMNQDADFSEQSVAMQIAEAIHVVVQIERFPDGSRKITNISHIDGVAANGRVNVRDIFAYDRQGKQFRFAGYMPDKLLETIRSRGLDFDECIFRREDI